MIGTARCPSAAASMPLGAADSALASFSAGQLLADAGPDVRDRARRLLIDRLAPHEADGVVRTAAHAHLVTATA